MTVKDAHPAPAGTRLVQGVVLVVVALGMFAFGLWRGDAHDSLSSVSVGYDALPVSCDDAPVLETAVDTEGGGQLLRPLVVLTEGMACTLRIQVVNDGPGEVAATQVSLEHMAPGSLLGLEAHFVNPNGQTRVVDAMTSGFLLADPVIVPAGGIATLEVVFSQVGVAEMVECSSMGLNLPTVTITTLGVEHMATPSVRDQIWFQQGHPDTCD